MTERRLRVLPSLMMERTSLSVVEHVKRWAGVKKRVSDSGIVSASLRTLFDDGCAISTFAHSAVARSQRSTHTWDENAQSQANSEAPSAKRGGPRGRRLHKRHVHPRYRIHRGFAVSAVLRESEGKRVEDTNGAMRPRRHAGSPGGTHDHTCRRRSGVHRASGRAAEVCMLPTTRHRLERPPRGRKT